MNRILQAEVILTLTREQADLLRIAVDWAVGWDSDHEPDRDFQELLELVRQQCAKQGVQL